MELRLARVTRAAKAHHVAGEKVPSFRKPFEQPSVDGPVEALQGHPHVLCSGRPIITGTWGHCKRERLQHVLCSGRPIITASCDHCMRERHGARCIAVAATRHPAALAWWQALE